MGGRTPRIVSGSTRFILALGAAALLAPPASGAGRTVTIDAFYDGGLVNLAVGDALAVRLSSGAGCSWSIAFNDAAVLKPAGDPVKEAAGTHGAPGNQIFRLQAEKRGSSSLGLACQGTSARAGEPSGLFRVLVVVGEKVNPKHPRFRESDSGSRIYLTQGDSLFLWLPATPSTGYAWSVSRNAASVLEQAGEPKFEGPLQATAGAPGTEILELKVVGRGASFLELDYHRPFENDSKPVKTWGIFVVAAGVSP